MKARLLRWLLRWWCETQMDQWERWKLHTKKGPVYITIDSHGDEFHWDEIG